MEGILYKINGDNELLLNNFEITHTPRLKMLLIKRNNNIKNYLKTCLLWFNVYRKNV